MLGKETRSINTPTLFVLCGIITLGACSFGEVRTPTTEATASPKAKNTEAEPDYLRHSVKDIAGTNVALSKFKGDVLLVVNTASNCGFTGQYKGLQQLHEKYEGKGLRVLGFPCNDFGSQEPGSEKEIAQFCSAEYAVTFPMFGKVKAKSTPKHPLYKDLTENTPEGVRGEVPWNFTKFLIGRDGKVVARFGPAVSPMSAELVGKVESSLGK
jgi:glutathione peroxidase